MKVLFLFFLVQYAFGAEQFTNEEGDHLLVDTDKLTSIAIKECIESPGTFYTHVRNQIQHNRACMNYKIDFNMTKDSKPDHIKIECWSTDTVLAHVFYSQLPFRYAIEQKIDVKKEKAPIPSREEFNKGVRSLPARSTNYLVLKPSVLSDFGANQPEDYSSSNAIFEEVEGGQRYDSQKPFSFSIDLTTKFLDCVSTRMKGLFEAKKVYNRPLFVKMNDQLKEIAGLETVPASNGYSTLSIMPGETVKDAVTRRRMKELEIKPKTFGPVLIPEQPEKTKAGKTH